MLDTITIRAAWPLRNPLTPRRKVTLPGGVRLWPDDSGQNIGRLEFSVPRVLFGHNGWLIENQSQIDAAMGKVRLEVSQIADVPAVTDWLPTRIDLAWNFDLPARALIAAHAALRVPGIRGGAKSFDPEEGVTWRGAKSRFMVTLYDKSKKMRVPGSVLRAEISLSGNQLVRRLRGRNWCDFSLLYQIYRSILVEIPQIQTPRMAASLLEAIGALPAAMRRLVLAQCAHKPSRTRRRWRQQIEASAARLPETFSWAKILPLDAPPPRVNVEKNRFPRRS